MGTNGPGMDLVAWVEKARRDSEYTALALAALNGETESLEELRYRFPWGDGPKQRWEEIPSQEVRDLVRVAMETPAAAPLAQLRHVLHTRAAVHAATTWNEGQAAVLGHLVAVA